MNKPDGRTWYEYIYSDEFTPDDRGELRDLFAEEMADEAKSILKRSRMDETRYVIDVVNEAQVMASDDWTMDEQADAENLRDLLAGHAIGDESVGVFVTPRDSKGEIAEIPPDHVPVDEYTVHIKLRRNQALTENAMARAKDRLNETVSDDFDE